MSEYMMPIPSRVYNATVGGHVAGADQIIDDKTGLTLDKVAGGALEEKEYTSSSNNGIGRVVLRKNLVEGVNTLTQSMINKSNTIYIIQYDFTLGENITIPINCVLEFDGGSIGNASGNNYKITYNNTTLKGYVIYSNVKCTGQVQNDIIFLSYYGDDDTYSLQEALKYNTDQGITIQLDHSITLTDNIKFYSDSQSESWTRIIGSGKGTRINTSTYHFYGNNGTGGFVRFINIIFYGPGQNASDSVYLIAGDSLIRLYFSNCFFKQYNKIITNGPGYMDHIQSLYFEGCYFRRVNYAIAVHTLYDIHFNNCVMETSKTLVYATAHANGLFITNCCLEGLETVVKLGVHAEHIVVVGNYFEQNSCNVYAKDASGRLHIIFDNNFNTGITICCNLSTIGVYENSVAVMRNNSLLSSSTLYNSDVHSSVTIVDTNNG